LELNPSRGVFPATAVEKVKKSDQKLNDSKARSGWRFTVYTVFICEETQAVEIRGLPAA
jgi:hypothetical protein